MPHPQVKIELNKAQVETYTSGSVHTELLNAMSHVNDNPSVDGVPLREYIVKSSLEHLKASPKASDFVITVPGSQTKFHVVYV